MAVDTETPSRRPRYGYWLLASVPVALFIDFWFAAFAAFSWCGLNYCLNAPSDGGTTVGYVAGVWVVTFLAVALPPWIPGGRRPAIAAAIGLLVAGLAALYAFRVL